MIFFKKKRESHSVFSMKNENIVVAGENINFLYKLFLINILFWNF